jgi:hypothetical protein
MGRSKPNLLPLLSNRDTTSSSLGGTRGSQASRYTWICGFFNKILGTRGRDRRNLTKDMMKPHLEEDKVANFIFTTLWARPNA